MKQRALMVLCVLFGAGLVMMCDSDAVQDMVDGEEAEAAGDVQAQLDALASQVEALSSRVAALEQAPEEPASAGSDWLADTAELFGITCPAESVLVTEDRLEASCYDRVTRRRHGPHVDWHLGLHDNIVDITVVLLEFENYADGKKHGLQFKYDNGGFLDHAWCYDEGTPVWGCGYYEGTPSVPWYECSTQEEVDALVAEHGCP